ncbi:MAG: hypothetical protein ACRCZS_25495 [Chroococcidiopsis sp.]
MMLISRNLLNSFIFLCLLYFSFYDANSSVAQAQSRLSVNGECNARFDSKTNEIRLVSKITVNARSKRARCIIRISVPNTQKQFRLVPLALKGRVNKAPATVAISSILVGDRPTSLTKKYTSPTKFDLTNQIPKTGYTTQGRSVFGINLVLTTIGGDLELTDMRFALQQR